MAIEKDHRKTALIVAGGPSAEIMKTFRVNKQQIAVIAVNGTLDWIRFFDYWFTLDPTKVNRKRMRTFRHNAKYFIAFPKGHILLPSYVTRLDRYSPKPVDPDAPVDKLAGAIGLNTAPNIINSGNSAYGALGLAYQLGFEKVGLIGVDANTERRVDGGYSRDLTHLPTFFESAMHQIDIVNCGDMVSKIPTMSLQDFASGKPHLSSKILATQGMDAALEHLAGRQAMRMLNPQVEVIDVLEDIIDANTLTPHKTHDKSIYSADSSPADSDLVLHEDLGVRKESVGANVPLPFLTTVF